MRFSPIILACLLALGSPAIAQSSSFAAWFEARDAGQVGERFDGYLGYAVPSSALSAGVRRQTEGINIRRRSLYTDLGTSRGASPSEIGITAGCTLLGRVAVGQAYLLGDNVWRRRGSSQSAPVPDYCKG